MSVIKDGDTGRWEIRVTDWTGRDHKRGFATKEKPCNGT